MTCGADCPNWRRIAENPPGVVRSTCLRDGDRRAFDAWNGMVPKRGNAPCPLVAEAREKEKIE